MTAAVSPGRERLKPCPFCSSEDVELSCTESNWPAVRCNECGTLGPCTDLHSDIAIEAWNARPATRPTSECDAANNACLELCSHHRFATGHGDTVADIIREIDAQITERLAGKTVDESREATIEECAKIAEQEKPGYCVNSRDEAIWYAAERIANNIRALSTGEPKP